jgi:hypothetical protein
MVSCQPPLFFDDPPAYWEHWEQQYRKAAMPGGVTLWKLIRVLGGGELLEKPSPRCSRQGDWTLNSHACPSFWRLTLCS